MQQVIFGLGSNVGDRAGHIARALSALEPIAGALSVSALYVSEAIVPRGAPAEWHVPFFNVVAVGYTAMPPHKLLARTQEIERVLGREARGYWGPREIDIDILSLGDTVMTEEELTLPHKHMRERGFVLMPLAELQPRWQHPAQGWRAEDEAKKHRKRKTALRRGTQLAGIMNLTPDSFSDGGSYADARSMARAVEKMLKAGADIIDVGAESTRPGAKPLTPRAEWQRLKPFFEQVMPSFPYAAFSIDTRHAETAARALDFGVGWVNDVSGFTSKAMLSAVKPYNARLVVMHSLSVPADPKLVMPAKADVVEEVMRMLRARVQKMNVPAHRIILDPGIGFGKTPAQSRALLNGLGRLRTLGFPLLVGHSRKSFLGGDVKQRDKATLEMSDKLMQLGVEYLRVHDVAAHAKLRKRYES